jgi:hypothetical protein
MPLKLLFTALGAFIAVAVFSASARADGPTKRDCVAANESAQDLRGAGKLREARQKLAICISESCPGPIREDCAQRLQEVEAAIPTITIEAVDTEGHDLTNVRVTMDGAPLVQELGGTALIVNPGEHRFVFDASGYHQKSDTFVVREGERNRNLRVVLETTAPVAPPPDVSTPSNDGTIRRTIGVGLGAAGTAGILLGAVFGVVSKSTYDHALQTECGGNSDRCTPQGIQDGKTANGQATFSTVAFIAGGAFLAAGVAIYFTAPSDNGPSLTGSVSNGGGGVSFRTTW